MTSYTKEEKAAYDKRYAAANHDRRRATHKAWRDRNSDKRRAYWREWREKNRPSLLAAKRTRNQVVGMHKARWSNVGSVYLMQCEITDLVKIGFSVDPSRRLSSVRSLCSTPIRLLGTISGCTVDDEHRIQNSLEEHRLHGEWFDLTVDQIAAVLSENGGFRS